MARGGSWLKAVLGCGVVCACAAAPAMAYARHVTGHNSKPAAHKPAAAPDTGPANPLLPPPVPLSDFFPDLSVMQKIPAIAPAGFEPLYSAEDWTAYRARFGAEADNLGKKRSSGALQFANELIAAAEPAKATQPGLARLEYFRAAAVCYRNRDGFATANKAVAGLQGMMDVGSATQVGALWAISNGMSRLAVTPKPERIRYSGIAARANTQLAILLVQADQPEAADAVIRMVGYHEGWLKGDPAVRKTIAQTRSLVHATQKMMDFLATQYEPAIRGDDGALMALYLYGMFVKNNPALVADFPSRKPSSPMAQLAGALAAGERDPAANYTAAETLRLVAESLPDGLLKDRTLYASLERYRAFIKNPATERDRVKRTLAVIAIQAEIGDGAHPGAAIHPFAAPAAAGPATAPAPADRRDDPADGPIVG